MAQICKPCMHRDSTALDAELLANVTPIAELVEKYRLSDSSLRRHKANHVAANVLRAARVGEQVSPGFLLEELVQILIDAQRVRESATLAGKGDLVLRAGREARNVIELLLGRLGVDDAEIAQELVLHEQLAKAVGAVIQEVPTLGAVIADKLEAHGHRANAEDIRQFAATAALSLEGKQA